MICRIYQKLRNERKIKTVKFLFFVKYRIHTPFFTGHSVQYIRYAIIFTVYPDIRLEISMLYISIIELMLTGCETDVKFIQG